MSRIKLLGQKLPARSSRPEALGRKLSARNFDRQTVELRVRIAILNRHTAIGTPVTQPTA